MKKLFSLMILFGFAIAPATGEERSNSVGGVLLVKYNSTADTFSLLRCVRRGEFEPLVADSKSLLYDIAGSPDGKRVAYVAFDRSTKKSTVELMDPDGSNQTIAIGPSEPRFVFHSLSWTPASDGFLYTNKTRSDTDSPIPGTEIKFYDLKEKSSRVLVRNAFDASISPDGRLIVFVRRRKGAERETDVFVREFDNPDSERTVARSGKASQPAWALDSKSILYLDRSAKDIGKRGLWQLALDGSDPPRFVKAITGHADIAPRFSLDGRLILFTAVYLRNPIQSTIMSFDPENSKEAAVTPTAGQYFLGERGGFGMPTRRIESTSE